MNPFTYQIKRKRTQAELAQLQPSLEKLQQLESKFKGIHQHDLENSSVLNDANNAFKQAMALAQEIATEEVVITHTVPGISQADIDTVYDVLAELKRARQSFMNQTTSNY